VLRFVALVGLFVLTSVRTVQAQSPNPIDSITSTLREILSNAHHPNIRWPNFPDRKGDLQRLYGDTGTVLPTTLPLQWIQGGRPTSAAQAVIRELLDVKDHGLNPSDYDAEMLQEQANAFAQQAAKNQIASARDLALFDAALSVAIIRLSSDLRIGRINPKRVKFNFVSGTKQLDLAGFVRMLQLGQDPKGALNSLEPQFLRYALLKQALAKYRTQTEDPEQEKRIKQIEFTLERWRWIPADLGTRFIAVNIPAFELYAFDLSVSRENPKLTMPVVVGKAFRHETPVFGGKLDHLVFRPYWNVPPGILRSETLPKLRRNPGALKSDRLEIVAANAPDAPATTYPATAENLARVASGSLRIRQLPGPKNALGLVKFMFPNQYNVYLHDTPTQSAFEKERRDLSHGCVRVGDPLGLAEFVLENHPQWTRAAIDSAMRHGRDSRRINLDKTIGVYILYGTAVAQPDGSVNFYSDIYKYDAALEKALAKGYPYQ
jgi:murein L,D-transpeptidase YcbB/YkuD